MVATVNTFAEAQRQLITRCIYNQHKLSTQHPHAAGGRQHVFDSRERRDAAMRLVGLALRSRDAKYSMSSIYVARCRCLYLLLPIMRRAFAFHGQMRELVLRRRVCVFAPQQNNHSNIHMSALSIQNIHKKTTRCLEIETAARW